MTLPPFVNSPVEGSNSNSANLNLMPSSSIRQSSVLPRCRPSTEIGLICVFNPKSIHFQSPFGGNRRRLIPSAQVLHGNWDMKKFALLTFAIVCSAVTFHAQAKSAANKPLVEITYRPVGKLIYVPVQVNGSRPLWFCFDTGAPNSLIDTATARRLNLKAFTSGVIHGAGKGEVSASDAGEVRLTVGGLATSVPHAKIVDLSKVPVPVREDGLLGAEFIERYVVRIDPARDTIAFYDPKGFAYPGPGKSMPVELTNSRLYVQVGLAAQPGQLVERRVRVDTGSEDSVDDDTVRSSPKTRQTILGNGLGTSYEDVSGVYDSVV